MIGLVIFMILRLKKDTIPVKVASHFFDRLRGLMGISPINYGMLFPECNGIHTFFMKEAIDIIGLDEENKVIYIYHNLPKNQVIQIHRSAKKTSILELPKDTSKQISMGDILFFEDEDVI